MNCKYCQSVIEELINTSVLTPEILTHLKNCDSCRVFQAEREKLMQILQNLQTINAPADFNFRVKALIKKQKTNNVSVWARQKFAFLVPTAIIALIIGFVIVKTLAPQQTILLSSASENLPARASQPSAQLPPAVQDLPAAQTTPHIAVTATDEITAPKIAFKQTSKLPPPRLARKGTVVGGGSAQPARLKRETEEVRSFDSHTLSVTPAAPPIMSPGIPDPMAKPLKQNGKDLLQTFGIKVTSETEGLRVVAIEPSGQGAKAGLETGDVIKKINNENPTAVSGSEFTEIKLIIRRKEQTREIKIVAKP